MTVSELIEMLQQHDGDAEVRIATQPNYPMALSVDGVASLYGEADYDDEDGDQTTEGVVWIATGECLLENPYAPSGVWDAAQRQ